MAENATTPGPIEHSEPIRDDDEKAIRSSLELWTRQRNEIERLKNALEAEKDAHAETRRKDAERIATLTTQVEALESERSNMESRVRGATIERDHARDREGLWIAFFAGIQAQFAGFDPVTLTKRQEGAEWVSPNEYRHRKALRGHSAAESLSSAEHDGDKKSEAAA